MHKPVNSAAQTKPRAKYVKVPFSCPGYTDDGPQAMHCTSASSDVIQAGGFCLPLMRNVSRLGGIARLSFSFDLTRSSLACIFTAAVEPLVYVDDDGVG